MFLISLLLHGTINSFFHGIATHELVHGVVFKTKILYKIFLYIFGTLGWHNFHEYRYSHTYHHLYTLHPRGDREVLLPRSPSLDLIYLIQIFTFNIFGRIDSKDGFIPVFKNTIKTATGKYYHEWIEAVYEINDTKRNDAINLARIILLFH